MEWLGFKSVHNMVNQAKIPYQTLALVRIAQKYEGLKQIEIMRMFTLSPSTLYRILNGEKKKENFSRAAERARGRSSKKVGQTSGTSHFAMHHQFAKGRWQFYFEATDGKCVGKYSFFTRKFLEENKNELPACGKCFATLILGEEGE